MGPRTRDPGGAGTTTITTTITGANPAAGINKTITVTLPTISVTAYPRIGSGLMRTGFSVASGNHGGVTVRVASNDPARLKVGPNNTTTAGTDYLDIVVPAGEVNAYFSVHGMENQTGSVTLTVSASRRLERDQSGRARRCAVPARRRSTTGNHSQQWRA